MRRVIEIGDGGKDIFLEAILWRGEMGPESERSLLNKARELRFLEGSATDVKYDSSQNPCDQKPFISFAERFFELYVSVLSFVGGVV